MDSFFSYSFVAPSKLSSTLQMTKYSERLDTDDNEMQADMAEGSGWRDDGDLSDDFPEASGSGHGPGELNDERHGVESVKLYLKLMTLCTSYFFSCRANDSSPSRSSRSLGRQEHPRQRYRWILCGFAAQLELVHNALLAVCILRPEPMNGGFSLIRTSWWVIFM